MLCRHIHGAGDIPTTIILSGIGYTLLKENGCPPGKSKFGRSMMMGIPIAACLGGFATPVGSGINVLCINLLKNIAGQDVTFLQWTLIGAPLAVALTPARLVHPYCDGETRNRGGAGTG